MEPAARNSPPFIKMPIFFQLILWNVYKHYDVIMLQVHRPKYETYFKEEYGKIKFEVNSFDAQME